MKIKKIYYTNYFRENYRDLPKEVKQQFIQKLKYFRKNCFSNDIDVCHLSSPLNGLWVFKITKSYRVLFEFSKTGTVGFIDIASHHIYN